MKSWIGLKGVLVGIFFVLCMVAGIDGMAIGTLPAEEVAIKGYDSVAYFTADRAIQGKETIAVRWHGLIWHFASKENANRFAARPEAYAPQYDGYCAWAMTEARKAYTDPEVWKIINGKLYLNCSKAAYEKWSRDIPGNIKKADANWKNIHN